MSDNFRVTIYGINEENEFEHIVRAENVTSAQVFEHEYMEQSFELLAEALNVPPDSPKMAKVLKTFVCINNLDKNPKSLVENFKQFK